MSTALATVTVTVAGLEFVWGFCVSDELFGFDTSMVVSVRVFVIVSVYVISYLK